MTHCTSSTPRAPPASDLSWIVGHEYTCYSPQFARNTSVVYEGKLMGTPNSSQFFRVIDEHKVRSMFTAPTAIRAIQLIGYGRNLIEARQSPGAPGARG